MQAHGEIHVLGDVAGLVAADGQQVLPREQAERAADDQVAADAVPPKAPEQERAQVFHRLAAGQPAAIHAGLHHATMLHGARIHHADGAADGGDVAIQQERARQAQQRVGLDERVGVAGNHVRKARGVDGRVQRIGLAAVVLVYDHEPRMRARTVDGAHGGRRQYARVRGRHFI